MAECSVSTRTSSGPGGAIVSSRISPTPMPVVQNARAAGMAKVYWVRVRQLALCVGFLSWLSLAESKILERLYADPASAGFVVESVRGVLAGTPVSKSWQHRFVGPLLVS